MRKLIFLLLILSACNGGTTIREFDPTPRGNRGVEYEMLVPDELIFHENDEITFSYQFKNPLGPTTSCFFMANTNEKYLTLDGQSTISSQFTLDVRDEKNEDGYSHTINPRARIQELPSEVLEWDTYLIESLCCDYTGVAQKEMCFDMDPLNTLGVTKACSTGTKGESKSFSECQGGPVCLTKVESTFVPNNNIIEVELRVYFANQGQGTVKPYGRTREFCTGSAVPTTSTIHLTEVSIPGYTFNCGTGTTYVFSPFDNRYDDEGNPIYEEKPIVCRGEFPISDNSIPKTITLKYRYGYVKTDQKPVSIFDENSMIR